MSLARRAAAAWRCLTWRHWAWATGIAIVVTLSVPVQTFDTNTYWAARRVIVHGPWFILFGYCFVLAIGMVESSAGPSGAPMSRYLGAALLTGAACVAAAWLAAPFVEMPLKRIFEGRETPLPVTADRDLLKRFNVASMGLEAAFHGCLATLIYARLRKSRLAALALSEAELGRSEANRNLLAAKLDAAHAAVDPAYVIDRLEAIGRVYEVDPGVADAQLDELTLFLRGAIPRLRSDPVAQLEA